MKDRPRFKSIIFPERNADPLPEFEPAAVTAARNRPAPTPAPTPQTATQTAQAQTASTARPNGPRIKLFNDGDGGGYKQWSVWIEANGTDVTTEWGHVGNTLSRKTKHFAGPHLAEEFYRDIIRQKKRKGYRLQP